MELKYRYTEKIMQGGTSLLEPRMPVSYASWLRSADGMLGMLQSWSFLSNEKNNFVAFIYYCFNAPGAGMRRCGKSR